MGFTSAGEGSMEKPRTEKHGGKHRVSAENAGSFYFRQERWKGAKKREYLPFHTSGFFILRAERKKPTIMGAAAPVLSKIIYLPALKTIRWQEKNNSPVGTGKPLLPSGGSPGTLPESWESGEGPPAKPRAATEERVWKWRTVLSPPCHGGRPSGHRGTCMQRLKAPSPGKGEGRVLGGQVGGRKC